MNGNIERCGRDPFAGFGGMNAGLLSEYGGTLP
jgi:hypothetical protein